MTAFTRAALVGGLLSIAVSGAMLHWQARGEARNLDPAQYFLAWSMVCLATVAVGRFSTKAEGWRRALRPSSPPLLTGAALSACLTLTTGLPLLPTVFWLVFYGLALLSIQDFAPRGAPTLGWAFLVTGLGAFFYLMYESIMPEFDLPTPTRFYPAAVMGVTFGGYHLVYAAFCLLGRNERNR